MAHAPVSLAIVLSKQKFNPSVRVGNAGVRMAFLNKPFLSPRQVFFTKINYTTEFVVLNGLYITLPICTTIYNNNKIKFDPTCNHNFKLINGYFQVIGSCLNLTTLRL